MSSRGRRRTARDTATRIARTVLATKAVRTNPGQSALKSMQAIAGEIPVGNPRGRPAPAAAGPIVTVQQALNGPTKGAHQPVMLPLNVTNNVLNTYPVPAPYTLNAM